jgi:hypothetical protein
MGSASTTTESRLAGNSKALSLAPAKTKRDKRFVRKKFAAYSGSAGVQAR